MIAAIEDRRSIRSYQSTPVSVQTIEQIIQAGRLAPSSKNRQPWKFIVTMGEAKEKALEAMEQRPAFRRCGIHAESDAAGAGRAVCFESAGTCDGTCLGCGRTDCRNL